MTDCQYAARRADVGEESARIPVIATPIPCLLLKVLLRSQSHFLKTYTKNYPARTSHFITFHSLNTFDLSPPVVPFQN